MQPYYFKNVLLLVAQNNFQCSKFHNISTLLQKLLNVHGILLALYHHNTKEYFRQLCHIEVVKFSVKVTIFQKISMTFTFALVQREVTLTVSTMVTLTDYLSSDRENNSYNTVQCMTKF